MEHLSDMLQMYLMLNAQKMGYSIYIFQHQHLKKQNAIFDNGFRVYNDGLYIKCDNEEDFLDFKESFLRGIPEERRCEYDLLLSLE